VSTQPLTDINIRNLPGSKGRPALKARNLTSIYEPIVQKMWKPRRLTTLRAFTACYRDNLARKADLTAICEPIFRKCGSLDASQPYGPSRPVTGIAWRVTLTTSAPSVSRFSRKCGNLDVSQSYGLSRPVTGIAWRVTLTNSPPSVSRFSRKCGNLDVSQHYGTSRPVTGSALLSLYVSLLKRVIIYCNKSGAHGKDTEYAECIHFMCAPFVPNMFVSDKYLSRYV
jgi:hypothetical protein